MEKKDLKETVLKRIINAGYDAYFVGGCVRDRLLGIEPHDYDIATTATPNELHKIFSFFSNVSENSERFGVTMPLITVGKETEEVEIATLRKDITKGRHPKIEYTRDIKEDAERRDFTINALYEDIDGNIIDPTGQGVKNINDRILRFVGEAQDRINEDPLRIFRFVRFLASKNFNSAYSTRTVMNWHYNLAEVSKERILKEFEKTLGGKYLFDTAWDYFLAARLHYATNMAFIMVDLSNIEQSWMWHSEGSEWANEKGNIVKAEEIADFSYYKPVTHGSAWDHTLRVMKEMFHCVADKDEHTRFVMMLAAFLHDIGKAHSTLGTKTSTFSNKVGTYTESIPKVSDHDKIGVAYAVEYCKRIGMNNEDTKMISELVRLHMQMHQLGDMKSKKRVWEITSNPYFDELVTLARCDERGCIKTVPDEWGGIDKAMAESKFVQETLGKPMPKPIVNGNFLISKGMKPNPTFKKKLDVALKMQIDKGMTDPDAIYKIIKGVK